MSNILTKISKVKYSRRKYWKHICQKDNIKTYLYMGIGKDNMGFI